MLDEHFHNVDRQRLFVCRCGRCQFAARSLDVAQDSPQVCGLRAHGEALGRHHCSGGETLGLGQGEYQVAAADIEVGATGHISVLADIAGGSPGTVTAALALDPRLAHGGRCEFALRHDLALASWQGGAEITPSRRGTGLVEMLWLRWTDHADPGGLADF